MRPITPEPLEQLAKRVATWKALLATAASLVAVGGGVVLYSQRYAQASSFDAHVAAESAARISLENRTSRLEAVLEYIHEDLHAVRAQEQENAQAIGARVLEEPHHDGGVH